MDLGLGGKVAVVSGSSRGVGRAIAVALGAAGAAVAVNYLHGEKAAEEAAGAIRAGGGRAVAVRADVTSPEGAGRLVAAAEDAFGPVDILVNNAHGRIRRVMFPKAEWGDHAEHLEGILKPAVHLCRRVLEGMKARGYGRIVNVGSHITADPVPGYSAYASAMAALFGFTRNLAREMGPWGVTVNMVSPGFVLTEKTPNTTPAVLEALAAATPLGRLARPEDVAGPVLFLCSDLGRFLTGVNLPVDGGKVMGQG